jgi:hypothetical protein
MLNVSGIFTVVAILIAIFIADAVLRKEKSINKGLLAGIATIVAGYLGCYIGDDLSPLGIIAAIAVMGGFLVSTLGKTEHK